MTLKEAIEKYDFVTKFEFSQKLNIVFFFNSPHVWHQRSGAYELENIKTLDQYKQLYKLLTGEDLKVTERT